MGSNLEEKAMYFLSVQNNRLDFSPPEITVGIVNNLRQLSGYIFIDNARKLMEQWWNKQFDQVVFIFFRQGHKLIYFIPVSSYVYADSVYWSKFKHDLQNSQSVIKHSLDKRSGQITLRFSWEIKD